MQMSDLLQNEREIIGQKLKRIVKECNLTQDNVAQYCNCAPRAISKIFNGETIRCTDNVQKICDITNTDFDKLLEGLERFSNVVNISAEKYGPYTKKYADNYIGRYLLLRRAYTIDQCIIGNILDIRWSNQQQCLMFHNSNEKLTIDQPMERVAHGGPVYMSEHIGLLHMLTVQSGAVRSTTLSKLRDDSYMTGATLTQAGLDTHHQVATTPVYILKMTKENYDELSCLLGEITQDMDAFAGAAEYLNKVSDTIIGLNAASLSTPFIEGNNVIGITNKQIKS